MRTATPKKADLSQSPAGITAAKLSKGAFAVLLANCIEVYKREAFGLLVGTRTGNSIYVSTAIPCQAVINKCAGIDLIGNRLKRLEGALNRIYGKNVIVGDYHSHPSNGEIIGSPKPSDRDLEDMVANNLPVYIILSIRNKQRAAPWHYFPWHYRCDGKLAGPFDKFWFDIAAYRITDGELEMLDVECPYALKKKF